MAVSTGDPWAYTPPLSLWQLVEQSVSPEEQDEIKSMLGTSLVETTLDLHREVKTLLEIWQDYHEETEQVNQNRNACPLLAEPPHVRDRLIQEICFLAESVREKSASKGMNPSVLLSRHNSQVLEYAEETKRSGCSTARPQSARSSDGRQTPLMTSDHVSSHSALDSTITEEVFSANDKLNYLQFDKVCNRLRDTLTREMEQLEADVAFLQACLTDAWDNPTGQGMSPALSREPTLTDLKEERSLLEKELLSTDSLPNTPSVGKPHFQPASSASGISTMPTLGPIVNTKLRQVHTTATAAGSTKGAPLKACHPVAHTLPSSSACSASACSTANHPEETNIDTGPVSKTVHTQPKLIPDRSAGKVDRRGYLETQGKDNGAGKREGPAALHHSRSMCSTSRVKVVPVGSVNEPRVDSAGSRSLMPPTPPPPPDEEVSRVSRPNSAQRFRRMVLSHREST